MIHDGVNIIAGTFLFLGMFQRTDQNLNQVVREFGLFFLEEAARRMKTNRNALYKLLHDARLRLKRRLEMEDLSAQEVLSAFETR